MALVTKDGQTRDAWPRLAAGAPVQDHGPVLVALSDWRERREELRRRNAPVGVWLDAGEMLEDWGDTLEEDLAVLPVIALTFPVFGDGRAYSLARLLRERHGYKGELRAVGDVLIDQIQFMVRVGFDAFEPAQDLSPEDLTKAAQRFSAAYQRTQAGPAPAWELRRRAKEERRLSA